VRLSTDGTQLLVGESGRRFVPWGFNYLGQFERLAEDDWDSPAGWRRIKSDFQEMRKLGANVVRWHLQFETFMKSPDGADQKQLARLKQLLSVARKNGLYLDLTGLNCYRLNRIPSWYDALPEAERWDVQARFWEAVAKSCADDPVVFCYDLMNEPVISEPAKVEHPWVTGELGGFYFVQRICNRPAGREAHEIAAAWVKQLVGSIRRYDPESLITVGVIPWAFVWPQAKPVFYSPDAIPNLDFVSIHVYPHTGKLENELSALSVYQLGKPLIIEETFPLTCSIADLNRFIEATTNRVDGWISHYFGHTVAQHKAGAKPGGPAVAEFLEYWARKGKETAAPREPRH
jgi:aryl-phospho-beta-D-glucosidase BglC (GH1 family)